MINLYITIAFFVLITIFFIYKKKKIAVGIFTVITMVSIMSAYQMYRSALEINKHSVSERRAKIISTSLLAATQTPSGQEFIKLVEFAAKDNKITNEEYNTLREFIPNEVVSEINAQYPNANEEERYYSRTSLLAR